MLGGGWSRGGGGGARWTCTGTCCFNHGTLGGWLEGGQSRASTSGVGGPVGVGGEVGEGGGGRARIWERWRQEGGGGSSVEWRGRHCCNRVIRPFAVTEREVGPVVGFIAFSRDMHADTWVQTNKI